MIWVMKCWLNVLFFFFLLFLETEGRHAIAKFLSSREEVSQPGIIGWIFSTIATIGVNLLVRMNLRNEGVNRVLYVHVRLP